MTTAPMSVLRIKATLNPKFRPDRSLPEWLKGPQLIEVNLPKGREWEFLLQFPEYVIGAVFFLERLYKEKRFYKKGKPNPLFALQAEALCRLHGFTFPQWVVDHQSGSTFAVLSHYQRNRKSEPADVLKAMGFDGTRSPGTRNRELLKRITLADAVRWLRSKGAKTPGVFADVAEAYHSTPSVVKRAYYGLRDTIATEPFTLNFFPETPELSGKPSLIRFVYACLRFKDRHEAKRRNELPYFS